MGDSDWGVLLRFQNHWLGRVVWRARTEGEGEGARERDWRAGRREAVVVGVVAVSVGAGSEGISLGWPKEGRAFVVCGCVLVAYRCGSAASTAR